jgi:hypothetical protein
VAATGESAGGQPSYLACRETEATI